MQKRKILRERILKKNTKNTEDSSRLAFDES